MATRYEVTFSAPRVGTVSVRMDQSPPKISDGNPIWETVQRPKRSSLTLWRGRNPVQLVVPVLFDGVADGVSVEQEINTLDRMKRSPSTGIQPPLVVVKGAVPRRDIKSWVITDITYGDNVVQDMIGGSAVRLRQDAVVTLLEHIEEERVTRYTPPVANKGPKHPFHVVRSGETLAKISQQEYGTTARAADIRKANSLKDSRDIKIGQRLRMPK
jgi:LysM repeat protein